MHQNRVHASHVSETILIAAGGALGALARYGVETLLPTVPLWHVDFPLGTLAINTAGSFALGWVLAWSATRSVASEWVRPLAGIGFCGAFTTFSTVTWESVFFARSGAVWVALAYLAASLGAGVLAAAAGERVAKGGGHG